MNHSGQPAVTGQAQRRLRFDTFEDVIADVISLRAGGYQRLGKWSLEQMCFHLGRPIPQPLKSVPSTPTPVMQPAVLDRFQYYVDHGHPAPGFTAPPGSEPPEIVEPGTIDDLFIRLRSAQVFTGDYVDLGTRGAIPIELYRPFILAHCAHHLSFLIPTARR